MKKKILISISTVMVLIVCAIALVACAPTTVPKYVAKLVKADKWAMESTYGEETMVIQRNGDTYYQKMTKGETTLMEVYQIKEGDKYFMYGKISDEDMLQSVPYPNVELNKWFRIEMTEEMLEYSQPTLATEFFSFETDKEKDDFIASEESKIIERFEKEYGEKDKKWYSKDADGNLEETYGYLTINSGKLEIYAKDYNSNSDKLVLSGTYELKAPKLALPADAAKLKP